jgi:methyltransferase (TIGR00027 family)
LTFAHFFLFLLVDEIMKIFPLFYLMMTSSEALRPVTMHGGKGKELEGVANTCRKTAAFRSLSHLLPKDPVASVLAGEEKVQEVQALIDSMPSAAAARNMRESFAVRSEWINRELQSYLSRHKDITQVVLLGAGMDTRAYVLEYLKECHVFEVDLPEVVLLKEKLLQHHKFPLVAKSITRVAADLCNPSAEWIQALKHRGYSTDVQTVFIMEGIIYYLSVAEGDALLKQCFSIAAPSSVLIADTMSTGFQPQSECEATPYLRKHAMDYPVQYLNKLGFKRVKLAQPGKEANFGMLDTSVPAYMLGDRWPCSYPLTQEVDETGKKICRFFLVSAMT